MLKKFFAVLAVMIFIFSATPPTTFANQEFEVFGKMTMPFPFEAGVITVTGAAVGPKNAIVGSNFYKIFARQAAKIDALRQLIEALNQIHVEGGVTDDIVKTKTTFDETFWAEHFSKIEVAEIKFVDNGEVCEVTVKATLK